ncbi:DUF3551 domain-containing protein [Bradyrhizobium ganzhouense]|uniref:DUF3551 domain-containing protein n=1 Tax=Bradyrhizobium ganzhouense TaxID=1179767 RepID=UPI003CF58F97
MRRRCQRRVVRARPSLTAKAALQFRSRPTPSRPEPIPRTLIWIKAVCGQGARALCHFEEASMRTLVLTILTMSVVFAAGHARAQTYDPAFPVCLRVVPWGGGSYYKCAYHTMGQCRAAANGQSCSRNPYYAGTKARVGRNDPRSNSRSPAEARSHALREPPTYNRTGSCNHGVEAYYGACQGYAPGEKERFLESVRRYM